MGNTRKIIYGLLVSALVITSSVISAYTYVDRFVMKKEDENFDTENISEKAETVTAPFGLNDTALFNYELYNEELGTTDVINGSCPYELIGKTLDDVREYYPDWQVMAFASDNVVLRKNIGGLNDDRYVVGEYEGCIAVFYENSEEGIYMMTDISVNALEKDKRDMISEGIYVDGKERLNRILEDYSS